MKQLNFAPVNDGEKAIIEKSLARNNEKAADGWYKNLKSTYVQQGNFLIALLSDGKIIRVGVAKRCPRDKDSLEIALNIALTRAARAYPVKVER